jgi:hypothetical protein
MIRPGNAPQASAPLAGQRGLKGPRRRERIPVATDKRAGRAEGQVR